MAAGTQCGTDRELALAYGGARHEQAGDVGAGDQQQEPHRAEQDQEQRPCAPVQALMQRHDIDSGVAYKRERELGVSQQPGQLGSGLSHPDSRREPADHANEESRPRLTAARRESKERSPDACAARETETRGEHADDRRGLTIQDHRTSDNPGVAAEPPLPQPIAQEHDPGTRSLLFIRREGPAERGLNAEHREEPGRHVRAGDRLPARAVGVERSGLPVGCELGEGPALVLPREVSPMGHLAPEPAS